MNCPQCTVMLQVSDRHGIEIDYCPQCRGVWLDRGELDKILEREVQMVPPRVDPSAPMPYGYTPEAPSSPAPVVQPPQEWRDRDRDRYRDDRYRDDRDRRRRRDDDDDDDDRRGPGGFLADLFDF